VASAVNHAHQRRVVHGDIKPSNIRMMANDRVRLLDFGVARLLTDSNESIDRQTLALTPAYAAPEQLAGEPVSTQSDIYALGMLLRWLLTGEIGDVRQALKPTQIKIARAQTACAIIQHATAMNPADRYSSVSELISDVQALVAQRPVSVRHYSAPARLALWAQRHKLAAAAASLAVISIVAGTAGLAWQERIVRAERDLARFEAERASLIREQLTLLFREAGQSIDDEDISARELLAESVRLAEELHVDDPEILAAVRAFLGEVYIAMDDIAAADPLLSNFVNDPASASSPDLLRAVVKADLAQIRLRQGESQQALDLVDESLKLLTNHPADNRSRIADITGVRGQALRGLGRWDEAIATFEQALDIAREVEQPPSRILATIENNMAATLIYAGRGDEAMPFLEAALDNWRGMGQEDSSSAITIMTNLASLLHQQGELDQAEPLYREAIERRSRRFGESGALGAAHLNLSTLLSQRNELEAARESVEQGIELIQRFEGAQTVNFARALLVRTRVDQSAGHYQAAFDGANEAERLFSEKLGEDHLFTQIARTQQAIIRSRAEQDAQIEWLQQASRQSNREQLQSVIEKLESLQPQSNRFLAQALCERAKYELHANNPTAALESAQRCLALREELIANTSWETIEARALVATAEFVQGSDQAAAELDRARNDLADILGSDHPGVRWYERWL
ncbi:MAG: tetratricopeptide repeat protein, partial [Pseudomonadota bacterium]